MKEEKVAKHEKIPSNCSPPATIEKKNYVIYERLIVKWIFPRFIPRIR